MLSAVYTDNSSPADHQSLVPYDEEKIVPLDFLRRHTKTDDYPHVDDFQLRLYRKAALEAAEQFTGFLLTERKLVVEDVRPPTTDYYRGRENQRTFRHTTRYPVSDNFVWYYGMRNIRPEKVGVQPGTKSLELPRVFDPMAGVGCCNPCGVAGGGNGAKVQYSAGFACESDIPASIALGVAKYVTHVIENPGDIVVATSETGSSRSGLRVNESSNPAWASGAIEIWRVIAPGVI